MKSAKELIKGYNDRMKEEKYAGTTPGHSTSDALMRQYKKEHPEKRSFLEKLADNRKQAAKQKAILRDVYIDEYRKQSIKSIKARAKQEAREKFRPTRKNRMDDMINTIGNLGGAPNFNPQKTSHKSKKKSGKKQYVIVGGKAYPKAQQGNRRSNRRQTPRTKKRTKDPFDLSELNDAIDLGNLF